MSTRRHEGSRLRRAVELDVNFIDTSDSYGPGVSERIIGETLHPYEGIVIATKGGVVYTGREQWTADGSQKHLKEACEGSLKRLGLERIDLYQYHIIDPETPFEPYLTCSRRAKFAILACATLNPSTSKLLWEWESLSAFRTTTMS
jgi:pyridoxine 4-dehydrogenase